MRRIEALKENVKLFARRIPYLTHPYRALRLLYGLYRTGNFPFVYSSPPGHFYSPIPDWREIEARSRTIFERNTNECPGVDLNEKAQLDLLDSFSRYYGALPFSDTPSEDTRYYYRNGYFSYPDAIILYSVLRHYTPRRVVEIGSGFSSAVMLDVNDLFLQDGALFTFVEPYPERLLELLTQKDSKHNILQRQAQDVPLETFRSLSENDILFVDSSHVVKAGSDVAHILFNILPELEPGVIVHFHDIFWRFEYPKEWLLAGRAWNEAYFLRSFLQFNKTFEIMYFNSFMEANHADMLRRKMPLCLMNPSGSIWLRKVA